MPLPLVVRKIVPEEKSFVLSTWKNELYEHREHLRWSSKLTTFQFWSITNYVIDKITLPSCEMFVGCHESTPETPICWAAVRKRVGLSTFELVYLYARQRLHRDPELAASLQSELLVRLKKERPIEGHTRPFDPFEELRR